MIKLKYSRHQNIISNAHPLIQLYVQNQKWILQDYLILDYNCNVRNCQEIDTIPINFDSRIVFTTLKSFIQNNSSISKSIIRMMKCYFSQIDLNNPLCIGGCSYLYLLFSNSNVTFWTNSASIYQDAICNSKCYSMYLNCHLVNYHDNLIINDYDIVIINLNKLHRNICQTINNSNTKYLIIISCDHQDFWKKRTLLFKYKIIDRQQIICDRMYYFVSVTYLIHK